MNAANHRQYGSRYPSARQIARTFAAAGAVSFSTIYCFARPGPPAGKTVTLDYRFFPGLAEMDGNWAALKAASDGKVYVGLACHGCDGHLVFYDSKRDRMVDAGGLTKLSGEGALHLGPQSKIHAKPGEGKDGRIYFATHGGWWFNYARFATPEGYPGAHYMAYDPRSGQTEDFGVGPRFEGINTGAYDPKFNRIYGLTHPRGHFVYFDVATGAKVDMGRINNWDSICRTLGIDDDGNVYGSFGRGRIFQFDPRTENIRELAEQLPIRQKGITLGRDYDKAETGWRVVVWDQQTRAFYGVEESATTLFSFRPDAPAGKAVRRLGQLCIPALADRRDVPYPTLSLALGLDRKLYYAAAGKQFDYFESTVLGTSHLLTYDLKSAKIEDLGEMRVPDGRPILGTNAADTGPDGTIYFVGAIAVKETQGEQNYGGKIDGTTYRLALFIYRPRAN